MINIIIIITITTTNNALSFTNTFGWFIDIEWGLSLVDLGSILARVFGFSRVMTLSKLCTYTCARANQAIHPFRIGKFIPAICRG